uniref:Transmembrane protein n=1 Tax=Mucochytrium quahogii TaxID=96639 RepID=A0A7S2RNV8_9STRA|mmetsp:Transcript_19893/g.32727  ORF Transcript_19893/g.32727 Transcript_19893/m.32727 type:complete len:167 (+) Transcript_19893:294-794(+)
MASRPRRSQYSRVDGSEQADDGPSGRSGKSDRRRKRSARAEEYAVKMHAFLWVVAAGAAVYYTEFIKVCREGKDVHRIWFNIGLALFVVATVLVLYMAIYVPRVKKCNLDPAVYSPKMLPFTAVCSVLSGICFVIGLWPVYGLFTPAMLGLLWIGGLMSAHFLPSI